MVCVGIYAVLINSMIIAVNIHSDLFSVAAYKMCIRDSLWTAFVGLVIIQQSIRLLSADFTELLHRVEILGFGVADDDVSLGDEEGVRHCALGGEGCTGTGRTQDQPVGVLEPLAVNHDHVVGQRVQPVVESFAEMCIRDRSLTNLM